MTLKTSRSEAAKEGWETRRRRTKKALVISLTGCTGEQASQALSCQNDNASKAAAYIRGRLSASTPSKEAAFPGADLTLFQVLKEASWERVAFPESECVVPSESEPDVHDGTQRYLCIVLDRRFPLEGRLAVLRPYRCEELWGWSQIQADGWVDHQERSVHEDRDRVVAWTPVPDDFTLHAGTVIEGGEWPSS